MKQRMRSSGSVVTATFTFLALLLIASRPALAQPKTDVVFLNNGDRLTGEVTKLSRSRLTLETDDAGTIEIEWDNVMRIQSIRLFEVETWDGQRLLGTLTPAAAGMLAVSDGIDVITLRIPDVTRLTPMGAGFFARLEGSVDAGFSFSRSSGIAQANGNGDVRYRRPAFSVHMTASATVTAQTDEDGGNQKDDRAATQLTYARFIGRTWFVSGSTRFETNQSLGLDLRSQLGGLVGRRLVNNNKAQVAAGGGLVANKEQGVDAETTKNLEGVLVLDTAYYTYDGPKTSVTFTLQYYPSLSSWGRQRVQIDSSLRRNLWKDFTAALNLYYTFDSAPPNPAARRTDFGITVTLGWTF
jgi:hypothetical protein